METILSRLISKNLDLAKIGRAIMVKFPIYKNEKIILLGKKWFDNYVNHPVLNFDSWLSIICKEEEFTNDWNLPEFQLETK